MSLRFRRSIKIAPGVRLNVTKTGLGMTLGGRGAHYSVHSSGRRTRSVGLPGTGLYYQSRSGPSHATARAIARPQAGQRLGAPIDPLTLIPKPGLFASGQEKTYHEGLLAYLHGDQQPALTAFERVTAGDKGATSAHLFAGVCANTIGDAPRAITHLEAVVGAAQALPDRYQAKYVPGSVFTLTLSVKITDAITASPPFGELAATLALVELYQAAGRLEEAIGLIQQLHEAAPDPLVRLSLCDLLYADKDYEGLVEASVGVTNMSDVEVETLHLRGAGLAALGHDIAALDAFRDALAKTAGRDPGLLNAVRYDRALTYEKAGQRGRARADLERLYAADPAFEDVKERLATMAAGATA